MVQCGVPVVIKSIPAGILQLSNPSLQYSRNIHIHTHGNPADSAGFPPSPCTPLLQTTHHAHTYQQTTHHAHLQTTLPCWHTARHYHAHTQTTHCDHLQTTHHAHLETTHYHANTDHRLRSPTDHTHCTDHTLPRSHTDHTPRSQTFNQCA